MPTEAEIRVQPSPTPGEGAARPAAGPGASGGPQAARGAPPAGTASTALTVVGEAAPAHAPEDSAEATRLDRLPMQLDVMARIHSFRVQDLLSLEKGTVVETVHEHSQDVPVRCGGAVLVWAEFEVLDQQLAVRITRLA